MEVNIKNPITDEWESIVPIAVPGSGGGGSGDINVIEVIQKNGTPLTVTGKTVNITVPTQPSDIGAEPSITKGNAFNKNFGTIADTVAQGNDSRFTDSRNPTSHSSTHTNGTDDIQSATALQKGLMTSVYADKLDNIASGAQVNILEGVQKNGVDVSISGKKANLIIPTQASDIGAQPAGTYSTDIHTNFSVLQQIQEALTTSLKTAYDGAVSWISANSSTLVVKETGKSLYSDTQADARAVLRFTDAEKTKLGGLDSNHWKGKFVSEVALFATTGVDGDYAAVDGGVGIDIVAYIWDSDDTKWVKQSGSSTAETAATIKSKYESNADTNALTDTLKTNFTSAYNWIVTNGTNVLNHLSNTSNPHSVTASQVGAYSTSQVDTIASGKEPTITKSTGFFYWTGSAISWVADTFVRTSRTINSKALSADVVLATDDISDTSQTNKFVTTTEKSTWSGKQNTLVSGTNIKTINGESLLGSGDLTIAGGGGGGITTAQAKKIAMVQAMIFG